MKFARQLTRYLGRAFWRQRLIPIPFWTVVLVTYLPPSAGSAYEEQTQNGPTQNAEATRTASERARKKFTVPFEMLPTNHMLVDAHINDKGPYRLIFDLGAPITLLTNRAAEATGVVDPKSPRSFLFSMRGEAEVAKLETGGLTAMQVPVMVLDHPVVSALEQMTDRRIDGLIGFTFFARYKTTIDYQTRQMTFEPVDFKVRDLLKELPDKLLGPKVARRHVIAPSGLWGIRLGEAIESLDNPGVRIATVIGGSPAARAGLEPGDVLISADGRWTTSVADVFHAAANLKPGGAAELVILRDGKRQTVSITPADGA